jgi:hypothetical protein
MACGVAGSWGQRQHGIGAVGGRRGRVQRQDEARAAVAHVDGMARDLGEGLGVGQRAADLAGRLQLVRSAGIGRSSMAICSCRRSEAGISSDGTVLNSQPEATSNASIEPM